MQTIDIHLDTLCSVDVSESYAFLCEPEVVRVFSLESCIEVLCIHPWDLRCSQRVEDPYLVSGDWFIVPLSVTPGVDECSSPEFSAGMFTLYTL